MQKNLYAKWVRAVLLCTAIILCLIICLVVIIDPFFHYHKPIKGISYTLMDGVYQNAGIVQHFDYDTLVTGSSMTQNFKTSWFDERGLNTIKVPYAGATTKDMNIILALALESNPQLDSVYVGLDKSALMGKSIEETRNPHPDYLYDKNPFNDVNYLLNKDVFALYIPYVLLNTLRSVPPTSFDEYAAWQDENVFSLHSLLATINRTATPTQRTAEELQGYIDHAILAMETNILPLVEAYPHVEFTFFDPPYSMMYWLEGQTKQNRTGIIRMQKEVAKLLLPYENVSYYLFDETEIIGDIYNYKDKLHYSQDVNHYMTEAFFTEDYLLTKDNYEERFAAFEAFLQDFDYSIYDQYGNPFIDETNMVEYLHKLQDKRYTAFMAGGFSENDKPHPSIGEALHALGLEGNFSAAYLAVCDNGAVVLERSGENAFSEEISIAGETVHLRSEGGESPSFVEISMDSVLSQPVVYTRNNSGLNIVVYDKERGCVIDDVSFDPGDPSTVIRN